MNKPWYVIACVACACNTTTPAAQPAPMQAFQSASSAPALATTETKADEVLSFEAGRALIEREGFRGIFVVRRIDEGPMHATDAVLASERYYPASTFKIPNALFGLQTGVAPDESFTLAWDGKPGYFDVWNRDHDLRSAMDHSVVWYFQELARRIGREQMQKLVHDVGYGNGEVGEQVDMFWLRGPLAISPKEKLAFIERMLAGKLPIAPEHVATLRRIIPTRTVGSDTLHAKTGTALHPEPGHAWLVGWTERAGEPTASFVFLLLGEQEHGVDRLMKRRWDLSIELLRAAGLVAPLSEVRGPHDVGYGLGTRKRPLLVSTVARSPSVAPK